jgi:uncharacterized protein (DUF983 family)
MVIEVEFNYDYNGLMTVENEIWDAMWLLMLVWLPRQMVFSVDGGADI